MPNLSMLAMSVPEPAATALVPLFAAAPRQFLSHIRVAGRGNSRLANAILESCHPTDLKALQMQTVGNYESELASRWFWRITKLHMTLEYVNHFGSHVLVPAHRRTIERISEDLRDLECLALCLFKEPIRGRRRFRLPEELVSV